MKLSEFGGTPRKTTEKTDADLSPDELREKTLKKNRERQEAALKKMNEQLKKEKKLLEKRNKEEAERTDPDAPVVLPKKNARMVDLRSRRDDEPPEGARVVKDNPAGSRLIELGPDGKRIVPGSSFSTGESGAAEAVNPGGIGTPEIKDPPKKPGFFDKLFGRDKSAETGVRSAPKGEGFTIETTGKNGAADSRNFVPASPERHDTLSRKVREVMAAKRLEQAEKEHTKDQPPQEKKAEAVDVAPAAIAPLAGESTAPVTDKNAATLIDPATTESAQATLEQQYQDGLTSRDVFAREAAFQRAWLERRTDAIKPLCEELRTEDLLAVMSANCLGTIGVLNDLVEGTLLHGMTSRQGQVRRACADALGRLRCRRAVPVILEDLKTEKNVEVRAACMDALGSIGDPSAIPPLKARLAGDEIETLKSRAALALARMGDPSGRAHLIRNLDSSMPALQMLGMVGLAQLKEPFVAGYLNKALESPYEEIWTTAIYLFPMLGPTQALPILRARLESPLEPVRRKAALAMGFLGSQEAVPYIERAVRNGTPTERIIGCELLGHLGRTDRAAVLIEKLQDAHTNVRQCAAIALARLNAKQAIPALIEASRGPRMSMDLPPGLRGSGPDMMERVVILSCIRILRGEKDDLVINNMPSMHDTNWPEVDAVRNEKERELVQLYSLADTVSENGRPLGVILKSPEGKELLYKPGEPVAGGYSVRDIGLAVKQKNGAEMPAYVILMRGTERITLAKGRAAESDTVKSEPRP
ncbi:MAG TPA: HEAT repeat domain-containing protein [Planctomycetota bacterium]|jgi:HEAT repeat protein